MCHVHRNEHILFVKLIFQINITMQFLFNIFERRDTAPEQSLSNGKSVSIYWLQLKKSGYILLQKGEKTTCSHPVTEW